MAAGQRPLRCPLPESARSSNRPLNRALYRRPGVTRGRGMAGKRRVASPRPPRLRQRKHEGARGSRPASARAPQTRRRRRPRAAAPVLLVARARPVGGDRRDRGGRLRGLDAAADPIARSAETAADGRDRGDRRPAARPARRDERHGCVDQGASRLPAEGVRRDRGSPVLQPFRRRSHRARPRAWSPTCFAAACRRAARPSPSSSPRTCS